MGRPKARVLTDVELEFMRVLWRAGEATTEDVRTALRREGRRISDGSVRKMLAILMRKGYAARRPEGRGFVYRPRVLEDKASRNLVGDLLRRAFGGSAALMVAALLDGRDVTPSDIEEIKRLIAEREAEEGR